jgi:hypothetical protein
MDPYGGIFYFDKMYNITTLNDTTLCGVSPTPEDREVKRVLEWWAGGVAVSTIGTIGIIGNTVSLIAIILLPSQRKTMFYKLLLTLAIFDILFISSGGLFMVQQAFHFRFWWFDILFPQIIYPAAAFGMTGTQIHYLYQK